MKLKLIMAAACAVLAMAFTAAAQKAPADFSGKWTLDVAKSKLGDRNMIESETMTVAQTETEVKVDRQTKRTPPPGGGGGGGGMGGGRGMGGGAGAAPQTYTLGKETKTEQQMGPNTVPVTMGSKWDGSKLILTRSSTFNTPNGEMTSTTKETWELGADGKTLTVNRDTTSTRGSSSVTMVYTKG